MTLPLPLPASGALLAAHEAYGRARRAYSRAWNAWLRSERHPCYTSPTGIAVLAAEQRVTDALDTLYRAQVAADPDGYGPTGLALQQADLAQRRAHYAWAAETDPVADTIRFAEYEAAQAVYKAAERAHRQAVKVWIDQE